MSKTCYNDCPYLDYDGIWICLLSGEAPKDFDIKMSQCSEYINYQNYREETD